MTGTAMEQHEERLAAQLADLLTVRYVPKRIEVTADQIVTGHVGSCFTCPVALAIAAGMGATYVAVGRKVIIVAWRSTANGDRFERRYETPASVSEFIAAYDSGEQGDDFEPFAFELGAALPQEDG